MKRLIVPMGLILAVVFSVGAPAVLAQKSPVLRPVLGLSKEPALRQAFRLESKEPALKPVLSLSKDLSKGLSKGTPEPTPLPPPAPEHKEESPPTPIPTEKPTVIPTPTSTALPVPTEEPPTPEPTDPPPTPTAPPLPTVTPAPTETPTATPSPTEKPPAIPTPTLVTLPTSKPPTTTSTTMVAGSVMIALLLVFNGVASLLQTMAVRSLTHTYRQQKTQEMEYRQYQVIARRKAEIERMLAETGDWRQVLNQVIADAVPGASPTWLTVMDVSTTPVPRFDVVGEDDRRYTFTVHRRFAPWRMGRVISLDASLSPAMRVEVQVVWEHLTEQQGLELPLLPRRAAWYLIVRESKKGAKTRR